MSYIKVDLGGKERGLKFNQLALETYVKNIDFTGGSVVSAVYATFYAGLIGNSYAKQEDVDYTFENVTDWVDTLYAEGRKEDIERVCNAWEETLVYRNWLAEFKERVRTILEPEADSKPKKKMKSTLSGSASTSSPLVHSV